MSKYSRAIDVPAFNWRAGELANLLRDLHAEVLAGVGAAAPTVRHSQTLPDGTSVNHPEGEIDVLETICSLSDGDEVHINWQGPEAKRYFIAVRPVHGSRPEIHIFAAAPDAPTLNRILDFLGTRFRSSSGGSPYSESGPPTRPASMASASPSPAQQITQTVVVNAGGGSSSTSTKASDPRTELAKVHLDGVYKILAAAIAGGAAIVWWKLTHP